MNMYIREENVLDWLKLYNVEQLQVPLRTLPVWKGCSGEEEEEGGAKEDESAPTNVTNTMNRITSIRTRFKQNWSKQNTYVT